MHDLLIDRQVALCTEDLRRYAELVGLDTARFERDLDDRLGAARVAEDVESAELSSVAGTPSFFVNGRRHQGAYDIATLSAAVRTARERAEVSA